MTAEIAIMNLGAVALAADSAVTARVRGSQKIFPSQNKLFSLSSVSPVGILVFGTANYLSMPWETLIKDYRHRHGRQTFPALADYASDFKRYLAEEVVHHISDDQQQEFALSLISVVYQAIADKASSKFGEALRNLVLRGEQTTAEDMAALRSSFVDDFVDEFYQRGRAAPQVEGANKELIRNQINRIRPELRRLRENFFGTNLNSRRRRRLNQIAESALQSMLDRILMEPSPLKSGLVIAGFGENDMFPALAEIHVEGLVGKLVKKIDVREVVLGPNQSASIVPFAQSDMIVQFMQGMAPEYEDFLDSSITTVLQDYTKVVLEDLDRYSETERSAIEERLKDAYPGIVRDFLKRIDDVATSNYASPIMGVVAMLPKDQLAEMAEALVSLTSLKRRVSLEDETVGGPTDVAVITKGDGLVWIKRKHYFPAELNPAYFARTYQRGGHNATEGAHQQNRAGN